MRRDPSKKTRQRRCHFGSIDAAADFPNAVSATGSQMKSDAAIRAVDSSSCDGWQDRSYSCSCHCHELDWSYKLHGLAAYYCCSGLLPMDGARMKLRYFADELQEVETSTGGRWRLHRSLPAQRRLLPLITCQSPYELFDLLLFH